MRILEVFERAGKSAGDIAIAQQAASRIVVDKGDAHDFATQADIDSGSAIERILKTNLPQYNIVSEENRSGLATSDFMKQRQAILDSGTFIVFDDLDATFVYNHGVRIGRSVYGGENFGHQIGLVENHVLTHSMMHMPRVDLTITAKRGAGCFINAQPHRLTGQATPANSLFYLVRHKDAHQSFDELMSQIVYGLGPGGYVCLNSNIGGLSRMALGELGAFIGTGKIWDFVGLLAVQEAGGFIASADGAPLNWSRIPQVVVAAANQEIGETILSITRQYPGYEQHFWNNPRFQS